MIDIIIPVFNQAELTIRCLQSIRKYTKDYRVILINNGSEKTEWEEIKKELQRNKEYVIINNKENLGFIKATNQGIATSTAEKIVLMNNDTEAVKGWADELLRLFSEGDRIGMTAPMCSVADSWQNIEKLKKVWGRNLPRKGYRKANQMVAFFCVMIDREVIRKVGYLSEDFGVGLGDDDWYCHLVREAGFEILVSTKIVIPHYHRTTFKTLYKEKELKKMQKENINKFKMKITTGDEWQIF